MWDPVSPGEWNWNIKFIPVTKGYERVVWASEELEWEEPK